MSLGTYPKRFRDWAHKRKKLQKASVVPIALGASPTDLDVDFIVDNTVDGWVILYLSPTVPGKLNSLKMAMIGLQAFDVQTGMWCVNHAVKFPENAVIPRLFKDDPGELRFATQTEISDYLMRLRREHEGLVVLLTNAGWTSDVYNLGHRVLDMIEQALRAQVLRNRLPRSK